MSESKKGKNAANDLETKRQVYASGIPHLPDLEIQRAVRVALEEDKAEFDVTTNAIFLAQQNTQGRIFVKNDCVVCGVRLVEEAFRHFNPAITLEFLKHDGEKLKAQDTIVRFQGDIRGVLRAERVALNFLAFMSAIATRTRRVVDIVAPYGVRVLDTRKTIPTLRTLSKYAVVMGGGLNHRHNLAEMGMIKDNHIAEAGSVSKAINAFRKHAPKIPLELEVDTIEQLEEALPLKPDMVLLDNMDSKTMAVATKLIREANQKMGTKITSEASGGFSLEAMGRLENSGVDFVSLGSITNTIEPPDFSLEILTT
ncbi:MAG: Nicotinate-nucleotide pyrophosphorylase [carboxylating] [Turneriella sp.]|nr:Nicotinate-nucleotide pyrophosphorylase [carboxylating] [Turneriella sp.]